SRNPLFEIRMFETYVSDRLRYFKYFGVLMQEMELQLDESLLKRIIKMISAFQKEEHEVVIPRDELDTAIESLCKDDFKTLSALEVKFERMLFFDTLELYPVRLKASYSANAVQVGKGVFHHIKKSLGVIAKSFKDASIKLDGQRLIHAYY